MNRTEDLNEPMQYPFCVIGTGPCSLAACNTLISNGVIPLVLDIGSTDQISYANLKKSDLKKIPRYIGSNSMYSSIEENNLSSKIDFLRSIGFGGLSSVWGGSISKPIAKEIDGWPISLLDLETGFIEIDKIVAQIGSNDQYACSRKLKKNIIQSSHKNIINLSSELGASRIAVSDNDLDEPFSAGPLFYKWISENKINYFPNSEVVSVEEKNEQVHITCKNGNKFIVGKLYIAAGSIGTAMIILNSDNNINNLCIKESKLIISLWCSGKKISKVSNSKFPIYFVGSTEQNNSHTQIYNLNYKILSVFFKNSRVFYYLFFVLNPFLKYFYLSFSYLDEKHSSQLMLHKYGAQITSKVLINNNYQEALKKEKFKLNKLLPSLKRIFIFSKKKFGYGYHIGSIFPMNNMIMVLIYLED